MDWLTDLGRLCSSSQSLPAWPVIVLSDEDPPVFSSETGQEAEPTYDVEQWLGCYCWRSGEVTLWQKGICMAAAALGVSYLDLLNVVLIHELGHWFNHRAPVGTGAVWWDADASERYLKCRRYDEVWAQLFVWRYGRDRDAGVLAAFEKLEPRQSGPYKAWRRLFSDADEPGGSSYRLNDLRKFISTDPEENFREVLRSLEWSRQHGKAARFDEKGSCKQNMLNYLLDLRLEIVKELTRDDDEENDISNW